MKTKSTPAPTPLPFMATFDDAARLYQAEKDPFYLAAFMTQCWLGTLVQRATAEYAEKKHPRDRVLQSGQAWSEFLALFKPKSENSFRLLLSLLLRFTLSDNSPGNSLRQALAPLSTEHASLPPGCEQSTNSSLHQPTNPPIHQPLLRRWCDWLDAAIHLRVHRRWHTSPACFSADPETRHLAALGHAQRHLATLDPRGQAAWLSDFAAAAELFKGSPKWAALGQGMSAEPSRLWQYPELDTLVISLWPLVKQYNWTYRDLLNVIRPGLKRPEAYPCEREQDFATYCVNVLGLQKPGRGRSAKDGRPRGYEIAKKLFTGVDAKAKG